MHCDDERRPGVLASIASIRQQFAADGIDLKAYSDGQVVEALLATCLPILGSHVWLNEKHRLRTARLLRLMFRV